MLIEDRPFSWDHVSKVNPSAPGNAVCISTHGRTVFLDGWPIACIGFFKLWDGVAEAWTIFGADVPPKAARWCILQARDRMEEMMRDAGIHRLQATVPVDNFMGRRLALAIGLEFESYVEAYGADGADHVRFKKVTHHDRAAA